LDEFFFFGFEAEFEEGLSVRGEEGFVRDLGLVG
jgi:hypothetical protein